MYVGRAVAACTDVQGSYCKNSVHCKSERWMVADDLLVCSTVFQKCSYQQLVAEAVRVV